MTTRTFRTRITGRACENFGAVDYTITDAITEQDGGVLVVSTSRGKCEGAHVDARSEKFWPGVTLEKAAAYRLRSGYSEVRS